MQLSKNNYILPSGMGSTFGVLFDELSKQYDNYFVESCRAAKEVYDLKQGKVYMLYSGGVDSEYALSIFLSLGMDITPVIINLNPNYNDFDIKYATDFCNRKNMFLKNIVFFFSKQLLTVRTAVFEHFNKVRTGHQ
jgi:hypothetical protein